MISRQAPCWAPDFLEAPGRRLFALGSRPAEPRLGILVCPAFGEEMNRTRRTVHNLASAARSDEVALLEIDLYGTGDSDGDFADARWETWLEDLEIGAQWLLQAGCGGIVLLAIRAGGLLACDLLARSGYPYVAAVLWQPVLTGSSIVTDLLRLRVAAQAMNDRRETVAELRQQLQSGSAVEAGGYTLAPDLFVALERRTLPEMRPRIPALIWIEVSSAGPRPAAVQLSTRWSQDTTGVELLCQEDPPFWSTTEIAVGESTIARTLAALRNLRP